MARWPLGWKYVPEEGSDWRLRGCFRRAQGFREGRLPCLGYALRRHAGGGARATLRYLRAAANLGPPPTDADEEESPVVKEFRSLALKSVANELKDPADHEQSEGVEPQTMKEESCDEDGD